LANTMGGRVEGLLCADPGARTPIGVSGILLNNLIDFILNDLYYYVLTLLFYFLLFT
jgi:hypothetical protein